MTAWLTFLLGLCLQVRVANQGDCTVRATLLLGNQPLATVMVLPKANRRLEADGEPKDVAVLIEGVGCKYDRFTLYNTARSRFMELTVGRDEYDSSLRGVLNP